MDPLSITANVLALATVALKSSKVLYGLVDGLADAPNSVSQTKSLLSQTQNTLGALTRTLETSSESEPVALGSVLGETELSKALESTNSTCQAIAATVTKFTKHSTDSHFSKRDRVAVYLQEPRMSKLNKDLADCQRTITMVLSSVTLIVTRRASGNIDQLRTQFDAQERALANLGTQLSAREAAEPQADNYGAAAEEDFTAQLTASLQQVCQKTLSATRAWRTGQKFGDMKTDDNSTAMQGIVGTAHPGVDQSFGSLTTTKSSRAFQGQMDSNAFGMLFK